MDWSNTRVSRPAPGCHSSTSLDISTIVNDDFQTQESSQSEPQDLGDDSGFSGSSAKSRSDSSDDDIGAKIRKGLIVPIEFCNRKRLIVSTVPEQSEDTNRTRMVKGTIAHRTKSLLRSRGLAQLVSCIHHCVLSVWNILIREDSHHEVQCELKHYSGLHELVKCTNYMYHGDISPTSIQFYETKSGSTVGSQW